MANSGFGAFRGWGEWCGVLLVVLSGCGKSTRNGDLTAGGVSGANGDGGAGGSINASGGTANVEAGGADAAGGATSEAGAPCASEGGAGGNNVTTANVYVPLFSDSSSPFDSVSYIDPTTKHLIFRGAGRLRSRHEMEADYAIYPAYYFEGRTFGYVLDDSIPAGGSSIDVTFLPTSNFYYSKQGVEQEGGSDLNMRFWKLYGRLDGNPFAGNASVLLGNVAPFGCLADPKGPSCNTRKFSYTLSHNDRANREIRSGDQLQIEFGGVLARYGDGAGPPSDFSHVRNRVPLPGGCTQSGPPYNNLCYTQANYFSDSVRYVVGQGMVTPFNEDCSMSVPPGSEASFTAPFDCTAQGNVGQAVAAGTLPDRLGPAEAGWSAGAATQPYLRQRHDLYFAQMAPNILAENAENFVQGRRLFELDFASGANLEAGGDVSVEEVSIHAGLAGPRRNQPSCSNCHVHNGRGVPPEAGQSFDSMVLKTFGTSKDTSIPNPSIQVGAQLQGGGPTDSEGSVQVTYRTINGLFQDGSDFTLRLPMVVVTGVSGAPAVSARLAPSLIGLGLLEAIPEADLLAAADPDDLNKDGIHGVANLVLDAEDSKMHLGRFGWRASLASVRQAVASELVLGLGVTNRVYPKHDCGAAQAGCGAADDAHPELGDTDLDRLVTYVREIAVPPRRDITAPAVVRGEWLFTSSGCPKCHTPTQRTGSTHPFLELRNLTIHPYTDLLLHDLGVDLADTADTSEFSATSSSWRTPPLWGIGLCDEVAAGSPAEAFFNTAPNLGPCHYLHDGRASTLLEAVNWHGGEAKAARDALIAMSQADRDALLAFLRSL